MIKLFQCLNMAQKLIPVLAFFVCLNISLSQKASAQTVNAVKCVQHQARALGIAISSANGVFDTETLLAAKTVAETYPALQELREINADNAIAWCGEIGLVNEALIEYWPTKIGPKFEFLFSNALDVSQQIAVQNAILFAFKFYSNMDVQLAGTIKVLASTDLDELAEKMIANSDYPMSMTTAQASISRQCRDRGLGGFNISGMIVVCFHPNYDWRQAQVNLRILLAHEMSHEIQRQMTGYGPIKIVDQDEFLHKTGPIWLIEGSAIAFQFKALLPYVDINEHINMFRRERTDFSGEKLSQLIGTTTTSRIYFPDYAALSGQILANRGEGHYGFLTYWSLLARHDWERAFEIAFGQTPDEFYKEFR